MRFFALLDFQHMVLAFFLGLVAVIVTAVAWGSYPRRGKDDPDFEEGEGQITLESGVVIGSGPMAPLLVFLYVLIIAWVLGYLIIEGLLGGPI
jgi:hypothetical protein